MTPGQLDDRLRRRVLWSMPTGLYVVGSRSGHSAAEVRWNLMTANLAVQVATTPKLVAVAIDADAVTNRLVREGGCFSLSLLDRADRAVVRRFVKPVPPDDVVTEAGTVVSMAGEAVAVHTTGAPVLTRAISWLDCALREVVALGSHDLCIGEVVDVGGPEAGTEAGDRAGTEAGDRAGNEAGDRVPAVLRMEDTRMNYGG